MLRLQLLLLFSSAIFSITSAALSPQAIEGKNLYPTCHVCHNQKMDPPLGPPMWGVQRRYKNNTLDDEDFIQSMTDFVKAPTLEKSRHSEAVKRMGLMPALPLPDDMLKKISAYILEEQFQPPCAHWLIGVKRAKEMGDMAHAEKDARMIKRFCD